MTEIFGLNPATSAFNFEVTSGQGYFKTTAPDLPTARLMQALAHEVADYVNDCDEERAKTFVEENVMSVIDKELSRFTNPNDVCYLQLKNLAERIKAQIAAKAAKGIL